MADEMLVTQEDREAAEDWSFIECRHCSEYEGDFIADLAISFARHRITQREADAARIAELEEALRGMIDHYVRIAASGDCFWDPEEEAEFIAARTALEPHT